MKFSLGRLCLWSEAASLMCQEDICLAQVSHKADMCTSLALVKQYNSGASQQLEIGIDFAILTAES